MASNYPPETGIRVSSGALKSFLTSVFCAAGTSAEDADLLASILVDNDLRGTFSHGSVTAARYATQMLEGQLNPRPGIRFLSVSDNSAVFDGDGGLGHLPCHRGMLWAIEKAKSKALAAFTARNHGHAGAIGTFTRMAIPHGLLALAISSRRLDLRPDSKATSVIPGSPISIALPSGTKPPLVMDMGTCLPRDEDLMKRHPQIYWRNLALGAALHGLAGILAGLYTDEGFASHKRHADQGMFVLVADVESFLPFEEFRVEMDRFIEAAESMTPMTGLDTAYLAGGLEAEWTERYSREGIPVDDARRAQLTAIADRLGLDTPFSDFEHTRFGRSPKHSRNGQRGIVRRIAHRLSSLLPLVTRM